MGKRDVVNDNFYRELLEIHPGRYPSKELFFGETEIQNIRKPPSFLKKLRYALCTPFLE
jgi:hypothetical protein